MQIFVEILVILFPVFAKGDCSRQKAQHKKAISDQASACAQREDRRMEVSAEERSWRDGL